MSICMRRENLDHPIIYDGKGTNTPSPKMLTTICNLTYLSCFKHHYLLLR